VIVTLRVPPTAGALQLVGVTANVAGAAACVTVTVCPAIVAVALRLVTPEGFALAVSVTLPVPIPLATLSVSHGWLLVAVHAASLSDDVIVTTCVPPPAGALQDDGLTLNVAVPAAWVTVTEWPAIVAMAVRGAPLVVGAAVRMTLPLPVPVVTLSVSHA
jgi:hypothetical protein